MYKVATGKAPAAALHFPGPRAGQEGPWLCQPQVSTDPSMMLDPGSLLENSRLVFGSPGQGCSGRLSKGTPRYRSHDRDQVWDPGGNEKLVSRRQGCRPRKQRAMLEPRVGKKHLR